MIRRKSTEKIKDLLLVLSFLFVVLFVIFIIINTFFVNPVGFGVKLEKKTFSSGDNITLSSTIRNLRFFKISDVSIESYVVELDDNGEILNSSKEKGKVVYVNDIKGLSSKIVDYDFNTGDLDAGSYKVFTDFNYNDKTKVLSKDFEVK